MTPELAIIVPSFNERDNVRPLLGRLQKVLGDAGVCYEVIFVDDDSPDGTAGLIRQIAREVDSDHSSVRVLHRIGRRGLASACLLLIVTLTILYRGSHEASWRDRERNGVGMAVSRISSGIPMPGVAMK